MTLAVKQGRLIARPSFPEIQVHNARVGFFEQPEFEAVVHALPEAIKRIALVGYFTGWRKSEVLGLTWAQVDFGHGTMRLEPNSTKAGTSTKNKKAGHSPSESCPPLAETLRAQRVYTEEVQRRCDAVIPWVGIETTGAAFARSTKPGGRPLKRAGYPGRHFHDLRRTAARNLLRAGVPEHWAMQLCGAPFARGLP